MFRSSATASNAAHAGDLEADTRVLSNTLNDMGTRWLIGSKLAFMNMGESMLNSEFLELLPPRRVILELSPQLVPSTALVSRVEYLRSLGFSIALDDFSFEAKSAVLLEQANYVKLNVQRHAPNAFQVLAAHLRSYPVVRIAERVETQEHFRQCQELGLDGFQGFYFSHPETLSARVIEPAFANTLELLNLLRRDASIASVEKVLKRDLAMSYKLLRYVNSAAAGLNTQIASFAHAVTVLGYNKLYRWLTLLLITAAEDSLAPVALQKTVVTRARLMELLGQAKLLGAEACDELFVTGMFSLLDVLFDMPMASIMEHLQVPEKIKQALLRREGEYGHYLQVAIDCESEAEDSGLARNSRALGLDGKQLNAAHLSALAWVEELGL
ncbi:HDOD domain-containing protein [Paludibacterium yongneupense]|uniref:EAL and HDOD domain-containing protein n=1 Tax=Paludibacterium yongneupense TaxID=400061 RepID=UPI0004006B3D